MAGKGCREKEKAGIYRILNVINNKAYYGSSIQLDTRVSNHKILLRNGCHDNIYLQRAWDKYGEDNFCFEVVEIIDVDNISINEAIKKVQQREQEYLNLYKTYIRENGYNISKNTSGGRERINWDDFGKVKTKISKEQMSEVIELLLDPTLSFNEISRRTGILKTMIIGICSHTTYKNLTMEIEFPKRKNKEGFSRVPYVEMCNGEIIAYYDSVACLCDKYDKDHHFFESPRTINGKEYTWIRYNSLNEYDKQLCLKVKIYKLQDSKNTSVKV